MALVTTPHDIYRGTSGITLPKELSNEIWANAVQESAIMRLAQRIDLPGSGITIPVITADPSADWVAESAEKPVSNSTFSSKNMTPYKLAVIETFSMEFRRDLPALYRELVRRLPAAIGKKFDATVFNGTAPGTGFDVLTSVTAQNIAATSSPATTVYGNLVSALTTLGAAGYELNGWALAVQGEAVLLNAVDGNGYPIFNTVRDADVPTILGAREVRAQAAYKAGASGSPSTPNTVGFAGDWSKARYGIVDGINIRISDQATVNDGTAQVNLWQRNMFAVMVEAELGFVADTSAFLKLTTPYA